ncbi:MAG: DNA-binding response regulator [Rickettsiales bacterium]|nr:DNA-binding response regulator [Rickettsiales bacterium]MBC37370.1 DNA-binding response regulator [Rickettsiales bacterium]MCH2677177.1 response regulator transcription factor [Alphaproteobacteria bacterium]HAE75948.1 DNA-binding response regulator [Alphaproteobacteria bacterium]|tara:strand:+ start:3819 stop:4490 length:672 start_codon:yes stop_codon:yes gene_type:complete
MRILVVEDEPTLSKQIVHSLKNVGYAVDAALEGEEGYFLGDTEPYDAIVLDLGLPKIDGFTILDRWRKSGNKTPVLILTARDRWQDKIKGFDIGADDFVTKPFSMEEVIARVRALIRRSKGLAKSIIEFGPISLDTSRSKVMVNGRKVILTSREYKIFSYLIYNQGKVVSRTELTEHTYDKNFDRDSNVIDAFIKKIRNKIGIDCITTVRGMGYRFDWDKKDQ